LLFQCLLKNQDVFETEGEPLRISNILEVTLPLKDPNKVAYERKSDIPEAQGDLAEAVLQRYVDLDVLEPANQFYSNFFIPFLLVPKRADAAYTTNSAAVSQGVSSAITSLLSSPGQPADKASPNLSSMAKQTRLVLCAKLLHQNLKQIRMEPPS